MQTLNYIMVPATEAEDINRSFTTWRSGRCVALDEGTHVTYFIHHRDVEITEHDPVTDAAVTTVGVEAFPVRVAKPVSRDMAINAAEMSAYSLSGPMAVASFNASLARKHRLIPGDPEVAEHDSFITWVKQGLTAIGVV